MATTYPRFVKPIDVNMAQVKLLKQMDDYRNQQFIYNTIEPTLKRFAGKKVTKRLITALKKEYPKYHFYLRWVGSTQCYLEVKEIQDKPPYDNIADLSLFLGHIGAHSWAQQENGKGYYTMNMIEENNKWIFQITQMIQSTLNGMRLLKSKAQEWNDLLAKMQAIDEEMEKYNGLSTFFKFES